MVSKRALILDSSDDEEPSSQARNHCPQPFHKRLKYPEPEEEEPEEEVEEEEEEEEEREEDEEEKDDRGKQEITKPDTVMKTEIIKRLWSEDEAIKLLQGMLDYHRVSGKYAWENTGVFYEFIKELHPIDNVSQKQLNSKIKRLKKKYQISKGKAVNEKNFAFAKPHEEKLFNLSEKIWGGEESEEEEDEEDKDSFWCMYPRLEESLKLEQFLEYTLPGSGISFVKERLCCMGNSKAEELEENWRKLQVAETEVKLMRAKLIQEQTQLILDAIS